MAWVILQMTLGKTVRVYQYFEHKKNPWELSPLFREVFFKCQNCRKSNIYLKLKAIDTTIFTLSWELTDDTLKQVFMTIVLDEAHISAPSGMEECTVQYLVELEKHCKTLSNFDFEFLVILSSVKCRHWKRSTLEM